MFQTNFEFSKKNYVFKFDISKKLKNHRTVLLFQFSMRGLRTWKLWVFHSISFAFFVLKKVSDAFQINLIVRKLFEVWIWQIKINQCIIAKLSFWLSPLHIIWIFQGSAWKLRRCYFLAEKYLHRLLPFFAELRNISLLKNCNELAHYVLFHVLPYIDWSVCAINIHPESFLTLKDHSFFLPSFPLTTRTCKNVEE